MLKAELSLELRIKYDHKSKRLNLTWHGLRVSEKQSWEQRRVGEPDIDKLKSAGCRILYLGSEMHIPEFQGADLIN